MHRLLLTLLIVCLAIPAVAVEACAPPVRPAADAAMDPAMAMHEHHAPAAPAAPGDDDKAPNPGMQHGCIGCVPPLAVPAMAAAAPFRAGPFASEPRPLDLIPLLGPTPPPPRATA